MNQMKSGDYRYEARQKLSGQWGTMAGMTFLSVLINSLLTTVSRNIFGDVDSFSGMVSNTVISLFLLFAIQYGLYYAALFVVRDGRSEIGMLFRVFDKKYYGPLFIVNLIQSVLSYLVGMIIFIPALLSGVGLTVYMSLVLGNSTNSMTNFVGDLSKGTAVFFLFILLGLAVVISVVLSGFFQMAIWAKLDFPKWSISKTLAYAWFLIKDRLLSYFLLYLSFIGWAILGVATFGIGLLWVLPYINVSVATFYDVARQEKGALENF